MSSYPARSPNYAAERQFGKLLEKYGAVMNGTADDAAAITAAIAAITYAGRITPITFPADATACKINSGIVFNLSRQRVNFNGIKVDASGMSSGAAITMQGTDVAPGVYRQGASGIDNLLLIGPGEGSSVVGVDWTGTGTGRSTRSGSRNLAIDLFGTGMRFGSYGHLSHFSNLNMNDCGIGISMAAGTDAGENISIQGGVIGNGGTAISMADDTAELHAQGLSLDYNAKALVMTAGRTHLAGCHIETNSTQDNQIDLSGNGTSFVMHGGELTWAGTAPASYAQYGSVGAGATARFRDVFMHNLRNTDERLFVGAGNVYVDGSLMLNTPEMPYRLHDDQRHSHVFGSFESAATTNPLLGFAAGAASMTARGTGSSIATVTSTAQAASGTTSLAVTKSGATSPLFAVHVPVRAGEMISTRWMDFNPSAVAGTYVVAFRWQSSLDDETTLWQSVHNETIGITSPITMSSSQWTQRGDRVMLQRRAPAWANFWRIVFDFTSMSNGTFYLDDIHVSRW